MQILLVSCFFSIFILFLHTYDLLLQSICLFLCISVNPIVIAA